MVGGGRAASLLCETQACWEQDPRQGCGFLINTFPVSQHAPNEGDIVRAEQRRLSLQGQICSLLQQLLSQANGAGML